MMMMYGGRLFRTIERQVALFRTYSKLPQESVIFMDDNMVVCWHSEQPFPYQYSKPLPVQESESESALKIGRAEIKEMFHHKTKAELVPVELAKITYTTKHRWYPRARDKKAKNTPPDRPYL